MLRAQQQKARRMIFKFMQFQTLLYSLWGALVLCLALVLWSTVGMATESGVNVCDSAAHDASSKTNVPLSVLLAITRTETGRNQNGRLTPWPWTVNMEGKGSWFSNQDAALSYVFGQYKRGARSFDVGCFQINYRWHGHAFSSIQAMFDPQENARYAAEFLARLFKETGSWKDAAAAYHSRTPELAERYKKRFEKIHIALVEGQAKNISKVASTQMSRPSSSPKLNHFPLLQKSRQEVALGSLVPLGARHRKPFIPTGG